MRVLGIAIQGAHTVHCTQAICIRIINYYYRRHIKDKELGLFKDINFIWSLSKEPTTNIQSDWNVEDDESDEDYKKPLRAPGNRENVFGEIPGTRLV